MNTKKISKNINKEILVIRKLKIIEIIRLMKWVIEIEDR